jgi:hypothetical protein
MSFLSNYVYLQLWVRTYGGGLEWNVFVRVVPNQSSSTTSWMFMRPNELNDDQFEDQLKTFELEIDQWKIALENM